MCLGIPGRVVEIVDGYADQLALVEFDGARRRVNIGMLDALPSPGDRVLVHLGFAMELLDEDQAGMTFEPETLARPAREAVTDDV